MRDDGALLLTLLLVLPLRWLPPLTTSFMLQNLVEQGGLAARVRVDGGLGGVNVQGDFRKQGDEYITGDYNAAQNRATLDVNGGIGQIVIRTLSE